MFNLLFCKTFVGMDVQAFGSPTIRSHVSPKAMEFGVCLQEAVPVEAAPSEGPQGHWREIIETSKNNNRWVVRSHLYTSFFDDLVLGKMI